MKKLNFLIVMDDIASINYKKDTTLAMMWAIAERGHGLAYCGIYDLWLDEGGLFVDKQDVQVFKNPDNFYELSDKKTVNASEFDVILMRKDPPFDMNFLYALHLLEYAKRAGVLVANDPDSVRACNEKLFATQFSEFMSPTIVTAKQSHIRSFIDKHQDVIVKPLDGMGGMGVFRLMANDPNIGSTLEMLTQMQTLPIMAQKYLPKIKDGDKRVLIVGGKVMPFCLARIPQEGETRGNLAAGGRGVAMPLRTLNETSPRKLPPFCSKRAYILWGLTLLGEQSLKLT